TLVRMVDLGTAGLRSRRSCAARSLDAFSSAPRSAVAAGAKRIERTASGLDQGRRRARTGFRGGISGSGAPDRARRRIADRSVRKAIPARRRAFVAFAGSAYGSALRFGGRARRVQRAAQTDS